MSNQIVRKRLNSLKNITEELKNSTTAGPFNFSHIKSLIGNLKHISQIPTQTNLKQDENEHYPYAFTEPSQQINSQNTFEEEEYRPLFQQARKKQNKTFNKSFQESEIIDLRQENLKLQERLCAMREQLSMLKQKSERNIQEKENNKLPFFSVREPLQAFIFRYEIAEQNYPKIEYIQYDVELKLDGLVFIRRQKSYVEEFDLNSLINVKYIDSQRILLIFEQFVQSEYLNLQSKAENKQKELTYVFFKFASEEIQHKWDLSLFTNFNIVNSLHQKRLFEPYFRRLNEERKVLSEKNDITDIRQSKELDDKKEKDLLKILIKRRQEYLQIRTLIQQKLGHNKLQSHHNEQNEHQLKPAAGRHPDIPQPLTLANRSDRASFSSNQKSKKKAQTKNWQQIQYNSMSPSIIEQIGQVQQNLERSHQENDPKMNYSPSFAGLATNQPKNGRQESETYPFGQAPYLGDGNFKQFPSNVTSPRAKQLSINTSKINKSVGDWQEHRFNSLTKSKQTQNMVNKAKQNLQNGYYATKYSKDGFYPHEKKIFLSLDCKKLCWSEKDKESDYKGIPLEVITKIQYGAVGEGIKKHVKNPQAKYYCVIEYFSGEYKTKTMELGSGNYEQIKKFTEQLQLTVNNQRGIPLGHE